MIKENKKIICMCLLFISIGIIAAVISLSIGRYSKVGFAESFEIISKLLFYRSELNINDISVNVIVNLRLPRIIGSIFVGASLACAGTAFQALFSNPIASPDTLGVTHGASFGAALGIILGLNTVFIKFSAFAIGCSVVIIVFAFASNLNKGQNLTNNLLLIGLIVSSVFQSFVSILKYIADPDNQLPQITYWLMGSFAQFTTKDIFPVVLAFFIGFVTLFTIRWRLNLLTISESEARSLGVNIKGLRLITIFCATLLTAVSTSLTGGITWFGLIIPHITRLLVGNDFRKILPISACMGSAFLIIMDTIARSVSLQEIPISILTSLFGAPLFVIILVKNERQHKWK